MFLYALQHEKHLYFIHDFLWIFYAEELEFFRFDFSQLAKTFFFLKPKGYNCLFFIFLRGLRKVKIIYPPYPYLPIPY